MTSKYIPFWKAVPFFRILFPFIVGIIIEATSCIPYYISVSTFIICFLLQASYNMLPFLLRIKYATLYGLILSILLIISGSLMTRQNTIEHTVNSLYHFHKTTATLLITLDKKPVKKTQFYKAIATVQYEFNQNKLYPLTGKVITYFKNLSQLNYGSQLLIRGSLQKIPANNNPGDFNYSQYAKLQGITHQFIPGTTAYCAIGTRVKPFAEFLINCREKLTQLLRKYIPDERNAGLAEALLIGYRDDLDRELIQSYSNTGVVHIIAISGLHIGLIYYLLLLLLKPLKRFKYINWLSPPIILCCLWLFTILAGAQPSILRATIMFTFIIIGQAITRKPSIYNSLCISAFFLLCYNPNWLWDIGFQLSYIALISILFFFRPIYNWSYFPNRIIDTIWKLNAVTLAAQILTTPVCIFHFHQFPVYFLVSNFIAVPLSSIILMGELLLCCVSIAPPFASIIGSITNWLIGLMNSCIKHIEQLPFALLQDLTIDLWQTILLSFFILLIADWFQNKRKTAFLAALCLLTICISIRGIEIVAANSRQQIVIYNFRKENMVEFINGPVALQLRDSIKEKSIDPLQAAHRVFRVKKIHPLHTNDSPVQLFLFGAIRIMLVRGQVFLNTFSNKPRIDILVFSGKARPDLYLLSKNLDIRQIVAAGNLPVRATTSLRAECDSLRIKFHDVKENGAFVINLR